MSALRKNDPQSSSSPVNIRELLLRRGITPDNKFDDYQDYIEKKQRELKTEVVDSNLISARGNVHLAMREIFTERRPTVFKKLKGWLFGDNS